MSSNSSPLKYNLDDVLQFKKSSLRRTVVGVFEHGYMIIDIDDNMICTWNTADPFLEDGWHKV